MFSGVSTYMETEQASKSKKAYTMYDTMWCKPEGSLLGSSKEDQHAGPTPMSMCMHRSNSYPACRVVLISTFQPQLQPRKI